MARRKISLPTTQEIERLYEEGDIKELRALNERLAKTANQRMAQLYESNIKTSEALASAKYYLYQVSEVATGGVFSRSKKINAEQLVEQLTEEIKFLSNEYSTVSGTKQARAEKSFKTLTEGIKDEEGNEIQKPYLEIPEGITVPKEYTGKETEYFQETFLKFLSTDAWKDIKKYLYTTKNNDLLTQAGEAIARGAKIEELKEAYKAYLRNEIKDITVMWKGWVSVK